MTQRSDVEYAVILGLYHAVDEGDLTVIRPGIYCRERQLRDFSYAAGLPVINENCPACFEAPKERHHIKKLLAREEGMFPSLYPSLRKALIPLLDPVAMDLLAAVQRTVEKASEGTRRAMRQRGANQVNGENKKIDGANKSENVGHAIDDSTNYDTISRYRSRSCVLGDATEAELLAELVRRRQAVRAGGRFSSRVIPSTSGASTVANSNDDLHRRAATAADAPGDDAELNRELVELQMFCTANGCERRPTAVEKNSSFP